VSGYSITIKAINNVFCLNIVSPVLKVVSIYNKLVKYLRIVSTSSGSH